MTLLCRSDDIRDGAAKGLIVADGPHTREIVLVRAAGKLHAYVNSCPHQGTPLETFPDKFLNRDGSELICSTHGARFRVDTGLCIAGPCAGKSLTRLAVTERNKEITLDD